MLDIYLPKMCGRIRFSTKNFFKVGCEVSITNYWCWITSTVAACSPASFSSAFEPRILAFWLPELPIPPLSISSRNAVVKVVIKDIWAVICFLLSCKTPGKSIVLKLQFCLSVENISHQLLHKFWLIKLMVIYKKVISKMTICSN